MRMPLFSSSLKVRAIQALAHGVRLAETLEITRKLSSSPEAFPICDLRLACRVVL